MTFLIEWNYLEDRILAGNDGVKKEFIQIAHTLNKIGVINNNQLNDLIKEYII